MLLTLGMTGMDQATEAALRASFADANAQIGHWMLQNESEADYVIVDMDSMYGPMSWLRLHAAGKRVIGLTTAPRTQADYRLARPFNTATLQELLAEVAASAGRGSSPTLSPTPVRAAEPAPQASTTDSAHIAAPAGPDIARIMAEMAAAKTTASLAATPESGIATPTSSPEPQGARTAAASEAAAVAPVLAPAPAPVPAPQAPTPPSIRTPEPAFAPPAAVAPPSTPAAVAQIPAGGTATSLADWLRPGALAGRARYQHGKGPALLIDFAQRQYFGPQTLKPLAEYFVGPVGLRDFEQLDDAQWQAAVAAARSEPQSLPRLQWFGALLAGEGRLMSGYNPDGKFFLNKWPQTEREYPRHFRIATAMMKGPMSIAEIATASGVPPVDVVDFINANLTTGFAEQAGAAAPPAADSESNKGSLLDRLRGR
jgi:hypothetical protein